MDKAAARQVQVWRINKVIKETKEDFKTTDSQLILVQYHIRLQAINSSCFVKVFVPGKPFQPVTVVMKHFTAVSYDFLK
jgi:hypothetical protein